MGKQGHLERPAPTSNGVDRGLQDSNAGEQAHAKHQEVISQGGFNTWFVRASRTLVCQYA